jgi:hypothetical protein
MPNLSTDSGNGRLVELRPDLLQEDADIFRFGTVRRQGEDFLQLPAKKRTRRRFPVGPDLESLEFALVRGQGAALITIILRRQFHSIYRLSVWFADTRANSRASFAISRLAGRCSAIFLPLLSPKLPTQAFVPLQKSHANACPGREVNSRKLNHARSPCGVQQRLQSERRPIWAQNNSVNQKLEQVLKKVARLFRQALAPTRWL